MRQTLFYIPYKVGDFPVFGFGLLLAVWFVIGLVLAVRLAKRKESRADVTGQLLFLAISGAAIVLLPRIFPQALPIRGYGVMLLSAMILGVGLAVHRARQFEVDPEIIFRLVFWILIAGIVGARFFHVVQKWEQGYQSSTQLKTLYAIVNIPRGGLVVYGGLIGATVGFLWFVRRNHLPALALADLIAPSLALGLAFGRIGCLMNGCCYGGQCGLPWAVTFPHSSSPYHDSESPPYAHQHRSGLLHGIDINGPPQQSAVIRWVDPAGPAAAAGLRAGEKIVSINGHRADTLRKAQSLLQTTGPEIHLGLTNNHQVHWSIDQLPSRSLPVHPTQIYSAISALLICFFLLAYSPYRRRDGEVIALMLLIYPILRFLIEWIRVDEPTVSRTGMTVSQNVSLCIFFLAVGLWCYLVRQPRGSVFPAVDRCPASQTTSTAKN